MKDVTFYIILLWTIQGEDFLFFFDHTDQQSTEMLSKFDFGFRCFHHSGQDSFRIILQTDIGKSS